MLHVACSSSIISYIDVARYEAQLIKFSFVCFNEMIHGKGERQTQARRVKSAIMPYNFYAV